MIYIVRHCQVTYSGTLQDKYVELSEAGQLQATQLAKKWNRKIDRIYSSPLPRAVYSVALIAKKHKLTIIEDERLSELDYMGDANIFHKESKNNPNYSHKCGESLTQARKRFFKGIRDIAKKNIHNDIIISTHGAVLSLFLQYFFDYSKDCYFNISSPDIYSVDYVNDTFTNLTRHRSLL